MSSGSNQVEENTIRPYWASGRVIYDWRLVSTKTAIQLLMIYLLVNRGLGIINMAIMMYSHHFYRKICSEELIVKKEKR